MPRRKKDQDTAGHSHLAPSLQRFPDLPDPAILPHQNGQIKNPLSINGADLAAEENFRENPH
jgi:hypothetical protein